MPKAGHTPASCLKIKTKTIMAKKKWIIVDSSSIRCFTDTFKSWEDGWDFLYAKFPAEEDDDKDDILSEYFVVPETEPYYEQIGGLYLCFNKN